MVMACQVQGMRPQQAFDTVGELLESRYRRWEEAERSVPRWAFEFDKDVRMYIDGIKSVVKANLYWR